jgi:hypothetical protein
LCRNDFTLFRDMRHCGKKVPVAGLEPTNLCSFYVVPQQFQKVVFHIVPTQFPAVTVAVKEVKTAAWLPQDCYIFTLRPDAQP